MAEDPTNEAEGGPRTPEDRVHACTALLIQSICGQITAAAAEISKANGMRMERVLIWVHLMSMSAILRTMVKMGGLEYAREEFAKFEKGLSATLADIPGLFPKPAPEAPTGGAA